MPFVFIGDTIRAKSCLYFNHIKKHNKNLLFHVYFYVCKLQNLKMLVFTIFLYIYLIMDTRTNDEAHQAARYQVTVTL